MTQRSKHIFVTGGVASSLGKGLTASSLGRLLRSRGLKVTMQKLDPYLNVDPGTMNPFQHGEVFVTEDGAETDLDIGHYERFGLEELLLRVKAILRRTRREIVETEAITCGNLVLHVDSHEVFLDDVQVTLSPTEFRLLEYLMSNQKRVLTKQQLLRAVWDIDFEAETSVVDTYISYLRKKLDPQGLGLIRTVRGVGFQLREVEAVAK